MIDSDSAGQEVRTSGAIQRHDCAAGMPNGCAASTSAASAASTSAASAASISAASAAALPDGCAASLPAVPLYADETVSDLMKQGLRLIQPRHGFRFGEDTVLLADYAARGSLASSTRIAARPGAARPETPGAGRSSRPLRIADLGAGSGAATLLLAGRLPDAVILAVELEPHSLSALQRSLRLNRLEDRITALGADYSGWGSGVAPTLPPGSPPAGTYDLVVANPPYVLPAAASSLRQPHARMEHTMNLESLIAAARCLLRPHGRLVMVHRSQRLTDVLAACRDGGIEPRQLRLVASLPDRQPARFLLTAVRDARPGSLEVALPLVIRDDRHELGAEVHQIYGNEPPLPPARLMAGLIRFDHDWLERELHEKETP